MKGFYRIAGIVWLAGLLSSAPNASGAAPEMKWNSPFDGPSVNIHVHLTNPDLETLREDLRHSAEQQIINMLIANESEIDTVKTMMEEFPGYAYGLGWIDLDGGRAIEMAEAYHNAGFRGLKFHRSDLDYSDPAYRPVFEKAAEHGMVCVFHTNTAEHDLRVHPVKVDRLQKEVEGLKVIAYHLANPNFEVAGELMLKNQNMFFGMSGITSRMTEQHYLGAEVGREMLLNKYRNAFWHPQMWSQLTFGTDGELGSKPEPGALELQSQTQGGPAPTTWYGHARLTRYKEYYKDWLTTLKVPEDLQYKIMYDNAAALFGLPARPGAGE